MRQTTKWCCYSQIESIKRFAASFSQGVDCKWCRLFFVERSLSHRFWNPTYLLSTNHFRKRKLVAKQPHQMTLQGLGSWPMQGQKSAVDPSMDSQFDCCLFASLWKIWQYEPLKTLKTIVLGRDEHGETAKSPAKWFGVISGQTWIW